MTALFHMPARHLLPAAALAVLLSACGAKPGGMQQPPAQVGVEIVHTEAVPLTTELSGRTSSYLVSDVRPQVGGIIKARLFTEGGPVKAGQPLYQIDPATYQAALSSAQAALANAQAARTSAKLKADRYAELVRINAISKQDNDDAQAALQQAQAQVQSAQAQVQAAQINLGYTTVRAPISGLIGKSSYTPGALVTASQADALTTIHESDKMYVDISRSSSDVLAMKQAVQAGTVGASDSAQVQLVLDNGSVYPITGHLEFSDATVDEGTGTVNLRAVFNNPNGLLMPGMFVRARITTGVAPHGVLLDPAAVQRDPKGNASVFVVGPDSKIAVRPVTLGANIGQKWLVLSGLNAGDKVVVQGLQKIAPGAPVKATVVTSAE
ncbi:efflux RND transporter periplasmic adaptor subunit [Asticcacaulis sp. EMRT-3]|uniref:efflux RND transporter periplasmic adaptor subunit n=1 Tax=Asticcacaulis sp. EMRT-3 TaxID=3040349 RepID=UPI0024AEFD60|nr:efflux RND transporter periplasmic adaptor subunit [Asticcacaulis sp. EMRT-3]MDI7776661.1 efflux RND transporter periplasmic adaptor subunit [Asticcacaulis sp. EMRT-3]